MGLRRADIQTDTHDLDDYYLPASKRICEGENQEHTLDDLLGVDIYLDWCNRRSVEDRPMPEDWIEFLKQLAGPYGKAILKAYQIKYGVEHVDTDG